MNQVIQISPEEVYAHAQQGALIIDVREADEIEQIACDISNMMHTPMSQFHLYVQSLPKDKKIITLCLSGGRSFVATQLLHAHGYTDVVNAQGGILAWQQAGLPIK